MKMSEHLIKELSADKRLYLSPFNIFLEYRLQYKEKYFAVRFFWKKNPLQN